MHLKCPAKPTAGHAPQRRPSPGACARRPRPLPVRSFPSSPSRGARSSSSPLEICPRPGPPSLGAAQGGVSGLPGLQGRQPSEPEIARLTLASADEQFRRAFSCSELGGVPGGVGGAPRRAGAGLVTWVNTRTWSRAVGGAGGGERRPLCVNFPFQSPSREDQADVGLCAPWSSDHNGRRSPSHFPVGKA